MALASCLTAAAPAAAKTQRATFDLELRGTQVTTWHHLQPADPEDPCSTGSEGNGDQTIAFATRSPLRLLAWRSRESRRRPWSRPYLDLATSTAPATAERQGELRELGSPAEDCYGSGGDGDGGPCEGCEPVPPDCGRRDGAVSLWLSFDERYADGDVAPLVRPPRNEVELAASHHGWRGGGITPLYGGLPLGGTFEDCDWWIGGPYAPAEEDGGLVAAVERLAERRLFDRSRRRLVVHGSAERCYSAGGRVACPAGAGTFQGRTILAFRLTLTRRAVR